MDANVEYWQHILDRNIHGPNHTTAKERLQYYLASITLGRDFLEDIDAYVDRTGKREFWAWASEQVK